MSRTVEEYTRPFTYRRRLAGHAPAHATARGCVGGAGRRIAERPLRGDGYGEKPLLPQSPGCGKVGATPLLCLQDACARCYRPESRGVRRLWAIVIGRGGSEVSVLAAWELNEQGTALQLRRTQFVAVVEDDFLLRTSIAEFLEGLDECSVPAEPTVAKPGRERAPRARARRFTMPVLGGPGMAHDMLLHDVGEEEIPVILMSSRKPVRDCVVPKPATLAAFLAMLDRALRERQRPKAA